jgi:hypothetical protein
MSNLHPIFAAILAPWQSPPTASQLPQAISDSLLKDNAISDGTYLAKPKGMNLMHIRRCRVIEYHGNNRATFECNAAGHRFRSSIAKRAPNGKLPSEEMLRKLASYWSQGVRADCPKCRADTSGQQTSTTNQENDNG